MQLPSGSEAAKKIVDAFLLREREKAVSVRTEAQQENIGRRWAAAQARIRGARDLLHGETVASLALYKEAALLLIAAIGQAAEAEKVEVRVSASEAWSDFDRLPRPPTHARLPDALLRAREVLASDDPLAPDALSQEELRGVTSAAAETVSWLSSSVEPRSPVEIRASRRSRVAAAVAFAVFVIYVLSVTVFAAKNLALGKPVSASSRLPISPPPSGLTNGDIETGFGYHTNNEQEPWIHVDLGASLPIHEVRVYNRGDGNPAAIVPIVLQISDDDDTYTDVEERTEIFTRTSPWIAKLDGKRARFVRVLKHGEGYIALDEIEVY
jgi:hypothetical protein